MKSLAYLIVGSFLAAPSAQAVLVGQDAPSVSAPDSEGQVIRLDQFGGNWVVVYFYPKADTPGCTRQACSLRDGYEGLQEANATIIGVSLDGVEDQAAFKEKYKLPFTLLADKDGTVARAFGVLPEGGRFAQRKTFIINPDGQVAHIFDRVKVSKHQEEVLRILMHLQSGK